MTTTLELEPLENRADAQPPTTSTEVATTAAAGAVDLRKVDLTDVALAQFGDWKAEVKAATVKFTGVVLDMSNQSKLVEAKSLRQRTINVPIADARKTSTALKSKLSQTGKEVSALETEIVAAWGEVDKLITPQIDKREKELANEKAFRDSIAAAIKACHGAEADKIRAFIDRAVGLPSEKITKGIDHIEALVFGPELGAFLPLYQSAKTDTLAGLRKHLEKALADEAAEAQRVENERIAADLKRQADELAEQRAELARQQAALAAAAAAIKLPEPEPVAEPAPAPVVEAIRVPQPAGEPPVPAPPAPAPAPTSLVAQNNEARVAIVENSEPVAQPGARVYSGGGGVFRKPAPAVEALPADAELIEGVPCLKLGAICTRFGGLGLSVDFITDTLEVPRFQKVKASNYWRLADLPAIRDALKAHADKCVP